MGRRRTLADKIADGSERPQFSRYRRKKFVNDVLLDTQELDVMAAAILGSSLDQYRKAGFGFAWSKDGNHDATALRFLRSICRRRLETERALAVSGIALVPADTSRGRALAGPAERAAAWTSQADVQAFADAGFGFEWATNRQVGHDPLALDMASGVWLIDAVRRRMLSKLLQHGIRIVPLGTPRDRMSLRDRMAADLDGYSVQTGPGR